MKNKGPYLSPENIKKIKNNPKKYKTHIRIMEDLLEKTYNELESKKNKEDFYLNPSYNEEEKLICSRKKKELLKDYEENLKERVLWLDYCIRYIKNADKNKDNSLEEKVEKTSESFQKAYEEFNKTKKELAELLIGFNSNH